MPVPVVVGYRRGWRTGAWGRKLLQEEEALAPRAECQALSDVRLILSVSLLRFGSFRENIFVSRGFVFFRRQRER